jgi:protein-S-isoprenylcysteine O-methyltransferase Ste14
MKKLYIPPVLILYSFISMLLFYFFLSPHNFIIFPFNFAGLAIAFLGFVYMGKAHDLFKKHKTTIAIKKSTHLITEGVFSKTRNPMYIGMFFLILGFAIFSTNLISLVLPFVFILLVQIIFHPKRRGSNA